MYQPLVSVVVPVYNCQEFLGDCLASLVEQTYSNLEIIAVDDGSTDESATMLDSFARKNPRVVVLHTSNRGVQAAWMTGVQMSTGELIGFVDADDWVHPEMYRVLVDTIRRAKTPMVQCQLSQAATRNGDAKESATLPVDIEWELIDGRAAARESLARVVNGTGRVGPSRCLNLFERSLLLANIEYCSGGVVMGEDVNITLPCMMDAETIARVDSKLYFYRNNAASLTHSYRPAFADSNRILIDSLVRAIVYKGADLQGVEWQYFGRLSLMAVVNECRGPGDSNQRVRAVMKIYADCDARQSMRRLRLAELDRTSGLVRLSWLFRLPFLAVPLVQASDWLRARRESLLSAARRCW